MVMVDSQRTLTRAGNYTRVTHVTTSQTSARAPRSFLLSRLSTMEIPNLARIAAPMVNQSDLPFRLLVRKYGATATYTQMLIPDKILNDRDYLEFHQRDLELASNALDGPPTIVQVCGNDTEQVVQAAKRVQTLCEGIGAYPSSSQAASV